MTQNVIISIGSQIEEARKELAELERQMIRGPKGFPNDVAHYRREIKKAIITTLEAVQQERRSVDRPAQPAPEAIA